MTIAQIIVTTGGIIITGAQSVQLRTPFLQPLPLSGPVEQSPFMLGEAAWISMNRLPLEHLAGYDSGKIPAAAFRAGRQVEIVVNGQVVGVANGFKPCDANLDGFVDAADLDEFTRLWTTADPRSDFNADEFSDALDWDLWMNEFFRR